MGQVVIATSGASRAGLAEGREQGVISRRTEDLGTAVPRGLAGTLGQGPTAGTAEWWERVDLVDQATQVERRIYYRSGVDYPACP